MSVSTHSPFQWIGASCLLVAVIAVSANLIDKAYPKQDLIPVLASEEPTTLSVTTVGEGGELDFGSQVELYRFSLDANGPYTLRYLSFQIEATGMQSDWSNPENWALYPVEKNKVQYQKQLGQGERWDAELLQVRLFSPGVEGFLGEPGELTFALTGPVLSSGDGNPHVKVFLPEFSSLPYSFDWMWTGSHFYDSWLRFEGKAGAESLDGLPTRPLEWD